VPAGRADGGGLGVALRRLGAGSDDSSGVGAAELLRGERQRDHLRRYGTGWRSAAGVPGTFDDWRVPSVVELATLIDYGSTTGLGEG
jgi:hypothetical protein